MAVRLRQTLTAFAAPARETSPTLEGRAQTKLRALRARSEVWRRERDSNPRNGFPFSGFQDRLFQPLTHPSVLDRRGACTPPTLLHSLSLRSRPTTRDASGRPEGLPYNCGRPITSMPA